MDRESGQGPGGLSPGEPPSQAEVGAGGEGRTPTSEAEGVVPGQWVQEACLIGVEVDGPHTWLVPATGRPRGDDGVAEAAVGQPAGVALVQAEAPGGVELAGRGEGGVVGFTELQGFLEGELLRAGDEEHLPWGQRQATGVTLQAHSQGGPCSPTGRAPSVHTCPPEAEGHLP